MPRKWCTSDDAPLGADSAFLPPHFLGGLPSAGCTSPLGFSADLATLGSGAVI